MKVITHQEGAPSDPAPKDPTLAAFAEQAREFDGAAPGAQSQAGQGEPPAADPLQASVAAASFLLVVVREAITFVFKVEAPRRELDDKTIAHCAAEIGKADAQTGGKLAAMLDGGGPWVACAVTIGPVLFRVATETAKEIKAQRPIETSAREVPPTTQPAEQ